MGTNLRILILTFAIILSLVTIVSVYKRKIPVKYAILWFIIDLVFYLLALFPYIFLFVSKIFGFEVMSNLIIGIFIGTLIFMVFMQTIMISKLKDRVTTLAQEVALLNEKK